MEKVEEYIRGISYEDIPAEVIDAAKAALADYVAVTLAGSRMPESVIVRKFAAKHFSAPEARIFGAADSANSGLAALANAVAAHAHDLDDCSDLCLGHPTITVAPAAFAVGEALGVSGKELLRAYVLGLETMSRIAKPALPETSQNGWHTTSVFGVFGAAGASSALMGLSREKTVMALGIAASMAGGLRINFGTTTKPYHAGMCSQKGVDAAVLADMGLTSNPRAIEGKDGFLQLFAGRSITDKDFVMDSNWAILNPGLVYKRYPCCAGTHPALDCLLGLDVDIKEEDIQKIDVGVSLLSPCELIYHDPQTLTEAKFSMEYAIAMALVFKKAGVAEYSNAENLQNPAVQSIIHKIHCYVHDDLAKLGFVGHAPVRIAIHLKNGETISLANDFAKGNPKNPFGKKDFSDKFFACMDGVKDKRDAELLYEKLLSLEKIENIKELVSLC